MKALVWIEIEKALRLLIARFGIDAVKVVLGDIEANGK